jgi:non-specific serine/threonine protein kinase
MAALQLAGALVWFWWLPGHLRELQAWYQRFLSTMVESRRDELRAKALHGAAGLEYHAAAFSSARTLLAESLNIQREIEAKPHLLFSTLTLLGLTAREQADLPTACTAFEDALVLARHWGYAEAIASCLDHLGTVAQARDDFAAAKALYEESLEIRQERGSRYGCAWSFFNLGCLAFDCGDYLQASRLLCSSLRLRREDRGQSAILRVLETMAALAGAQNRPVRAARLSGATDVWYKSGRLRRWPADPPRVDPWIAVAQGALGEEAFAAARSEGQTMTLEEAVAYALDDDETGHGA